MEMVEAALLLTSVYNLIELTVEWLWNASCAFQCSILILNEIETEIIFFVGSFFDVPQTLTS